MEKMKGNKDINLSEVFVLRRSIKVVCDCYFRSIHFETDNESLAKNMNKDEEDRTLRGRVCESKKRESTKFRQVRISYTSINNNILAHELAKESHNA